MNRKIDKLPPSQSGNLKEDMEKVINYLSYLHEQINFMAAKLEKQSERNSRG